MQRVYPVEKGNLGLLPMKKLQKNELSALRAELESYKRQGVELWLDGRLCTPRTITRAHKIAEVGAYMRDYVHNKDGKVSSIHFHVVHDK